jgi:hypothetical protein
MKLLVTGAAFISLTEEPIVDLDTFAETWFDDDMFMCQYNDIAISCDLANVSKSKAKIPDGAVNFDFNSGINGGVGNCLRENWWTKAGQTARQVGSLCTLLASVRGSGIQIPYLPSIEQGDPFKKVCVQACYLLGVEKVIEGLSHIARIHPSSENPYTIIDELKAMDVTPEMRTSPEKLWDRHVYVETSGCYIMNNTAKEIVSLITKK